MMIKIDDFSDLIEKNLAEYGSKVEGVMKTESLKTARAAAKELRKTSPLKTGEYKKSWKMLEFPAVLGSKYVVHNKKHFHLTHLLEKGHALPGGGRSKKFEHIKPAEANAKNRFEKNIRKGIENVTI